MEKAPVVGEWSRWLLREVFADEEGLGQPLSTIMADDTLLVRAAELGGLHLSEMEAREAFLSCFPPRNLMLAWFRGQDISKEALPALLILCCYAASDTAESDSNDYRHRLKEIMGWREPIIDCSGLPRLWRCLSTGLAKIAATKGLRPLCLPDPGFRTQIGHAIELTFPCRPDARRLRSELARTAAFDRENPREVIRWLLPLVETRSFTRSFVNAFRGFERAWRRGERALAQHRFWSGWRQVAREKAAPGRECWLKVRLDEWGDAELIDARDEVPVDLTTVLAASDLPQALLALLSSKRRAPLVESGWGEWRWAGESGASAQAALAFTIMPRGDRREPNTHIVRGAPGWMLDRRDLESVASASFQRSELLLSLTVEGAPRIEGGRLARPSFPLKVTVSGPRAALHVSGDAVPNLSILRVGPNQWMLQPRTPADGEVTLHAEAGKVGGISSRVHLRRAAVAPKLDRALPARLVDDERVPMSCSGLGAECTTAEAVASLPEQGLTQESEFGDLVEYLAARPGPHGLGSILELLRELLPSKGPRHWDLLRSLYEGGLLAPLRVRGWRGKLAVAIPPGFILARGPRDGWMLVSDGLVHETARERIMRAAEAAVLAHEVVSAASPWAPETIRILSPDRDALNRFSAELGYPIKGTLLPLTSLPPLGPSWTSADGANHTVRRSVELPPAPWPLARPTLTYCERERGDAPGLWLVSNASGDLYWSERHLALLEACRRARMPAFRPDEARLRVEIQGAYLPLALARWLRWYHGVASGPTREGGYVYGTTRHILGKLGEVLGRRLIGVEEETVSRPLRRPGGVGALIARPGLDGVELWDPLLWARSERRP